jgi:hypothetical protein
MPIPPVDPTTDSVGVVKGAVGKVGMSRSAQWYLRNISPRVDPTLMRLTRGRVSSIGTWPRCVLVTHKGAKSGIERATPLTTRRRWHLPASGRQCMAAYASEAATVF